MNDLPCGPTQTSAIKDYLIAHQELEKAKEALRLAHKKVKVVWASIYNQNRLGLQPPTQETFDA